MDNPTPLAGTICGRAFSLVAGGSDLADGTLNKINIHKPNGNALKISRHIPHRCCLIRGTDTSFVPGMFMSAALGTAVALAWRKFPQSLSGLLP
jgi:hypothetical protein